jgi:microcystin degradation protein MlrC|eukprot:COSAG06_NODE_488_length_15101_cov_1080.380683_2_plen_409_part_00
MSAPRGERAGRGTAVRLQRLAAHVVGAPALPAAAASGGVQPRTSSTTKPQRRLRIAFGEYTEEADTFTRDFATRETFAINGIYEGAEMLDGRLDAASNSMLGGFLDVVGAQPALVEPVPLFRASGGAAPTIAAAVHEEVCTRLLARLREAMQASEGGVDAVFLALHGAACAEQTDDPEGDILQQVRALVGPDMPIAVSLDHHANITASMVAHADLLVGHQTQPHDPPDTGRKATRLLLDWLAGADSSAPTMAMRKIPMMTQQDMYLTAPDGPMKEWFDMARAMESDHPAVLDISPYPTQPWLDVAEVGWAVVVHTSAELDSDGALAELLASEMANFAWQHRERFWHSERVAPAAAALEALAAAARGPPTPLQGEEEGGGGLLILSDTGDSTCKPHPPTLLTTAAARAD